MRFQTLLIVLLCAIYSSASHADAFELKKPSCYPLSAALGLGAAIDVRLKMLDGPDMLVWWCETKTGLEENYRGGEYGRIFEQGFRDAIQSVSQLWELDRSRFTRPLSDRENQLLAEVELAYEPRCVATSTGKTTQVLSASNGVIGAATGRRYPRSQRPTCWEWVKAGSKLYCGVRGQNDAAGKPIEDGYVGCKITLAPIEGWQ